MGEAERLAAAGIRVHVLAIASRQVQPRPVLEELARVTGGSFQSIEDPTELPVRLANTSLSGVEAVEVRNATTGAAGLAVRLLPDGRFDAFVPLAPGENRIEVRARSAAGTSEVIQRTLHYGPAAAGAPRPAEAAELLDALRQRTLELELLAELQGHRQQVMINSRMESMSHEQHGTAPGLGSCFVEVEIVAHLVCSIATRGDSHFLMNLAEQDHNQVTVA